MSIHDLFRKRESKTKADNNTTGKHSESPETSAAELSRLRGFYGNYHAHLLNSLKEAGISVFPANTEHIKYNNKECDIFAVKVRNGIFALPYNGYGIRCLKESREKYFILMNPSLLRLFFKVLWFKQEIVDIYS